MTQKVNTNGPKTTRSVVPETASIFHPIDKAEHYNKYGIECKEFSRHFHGPKAQALQYIWRANDKGEFKRDLEKAIFWLNDWVGSNLYTHTTYESAPCPEPVHGYAGKGYDVEARSPAQLPTIEDLRRIAGNFSYNVGRALESVYCDNPEGAIALLEAELRRYESQQQTAVAVSTPARTRRGN